MIINVCGTFILGANCPYAECDAWNAFEISFVNQIGLYNIKVKIYSHYYMEYPRK